MGANFMTLKRIAWLVGIALLVLIANVGCSILYMVVYGHVIDRATRLSTTMHTFRSPLRTAASSPASR
jgi:outer membrane protein assembly factor BamE (lipoprotein component of BamABCDE complex)